MMVVCPLCGASKVVSRFAIRTSHDFVIYECASCGLAFAWPRPDAEYLARFYTATYFSKHQAADIGYTDYRLLPELNAKSMWDELQSFADLQSLNGRRILDVGCATGGFLSRAKQEGWDCVGLEISADAAEIARREYGLDVIIGDLNSSDLWTEKFDVITMWHVLEHLLDPCAALLRARDLLSRNGVLFMEMPNWNSLGRSIRGVNWSALTPPEHINFFTPRTLRKLVDRSGLQTTKWASVYPSLRNEARLIAPGRFLRRVKYAVAIIACAVGRGGYVRLLAQHQ
jgi:2-polyprenyl-3-methyl-5-hydroxy-6-metoxy-1,4-benzoquinol methylase